ncbi:ABC transporter ATP-binding protein, partial [Natronoarchaeum mannanilyticum]|uniref:ABC transporter ATP-binding protein n=1 Tax=Natronoarchaeum mannanilyticum TaxID=926360 RepID=UPI003607184C
MSELELRGVTKRYGGATALDGVDLRIEDGEFFTLVGPSGCGKTTTLRTIGGFEEPDAGEVLIGGESVVGVRPEDRLLAMVFQNYALYPHMSVAENVAYGLRFRDPPGGESRDERVADLLSLVDLEGFEDRDPDELSGGQRQRVA